MNSPPDMRVWFWEHHQRQRSMMWTEVLRYKPVTCFTVGIPVTAAATINELKPSDQSKLNSTMLQETNNH